jgi:hypothetical protein
VQAKLADLAGIVRRTVTGATATAQDARLSLGRIRVGEICGRIESADLASYPRPIDSVDKRQHQPLVAAAISEGYEQRGVLGRRIAE